ncbi:MAG TPA: DUF302 domain-containing protein [Actinobacteria bacterium]|nr:DUF302 domain-containing protein [Actinomycetes bacterium]HEX21451.1 DUF302 domain-containing protein [Actinomycetota bacterium]
MNDLIYETSSKKSITEVRAALEVSLKERKFGILTEIDVAKVMEKKGVEFHDELLLLGVCNPNYAKEVLEINSDLAVMLPCSIVIQKNGTGSIIKLAKPSQLVAFFPDQDRLAAFGDKVEELLRAAIDDVVADDKNID